MKETDRLIGGAGLDGSTEHESKEPALGYWLGQPHSGNGYPREAVAAVIGAAVCSNRSQKTLSRHCEEGSDEAISIG